MRKFGLKHAFLLLMLFSCSRTDQSCQVLSVDIDEAVGREVSIFDLFDDVSLVCLEDSHPISNPVYAGSTYFDSDGENMYILDWNTFAVHVFDSAGRLVSYSYKKGNGPGESPMAYQIHYNKDLNLIEVLNPMGKILRYTCDSLRFHSELDFMGEGPLASHWFLQHGDDYVIYSLSEDEKLWSLNGRTGEIRPLGYRSPQYLVEYLPASAPMFQLDGVPYIYQTYDGGILEIDPAGASVSESTVWDLGRYQSALSDIPTDLDVEEYSDWFYSYSEHKVNPFFDIKVWDGRIYAWTLYKGKTCSLIYDTRDSKSYFFEKTVEGMKFLAEVFVGDTMYKFVDSENLRGFVNPEILDDDSRQAFEKVLSTDGSAIIKYRMKKPV